MMAWPWVVALDLGACLARLFDDQVGGMGLDHSFDACLFVPRYDNEARAVGCDAVVFRRRQLDPLHTSAGCALAMERK